MSCFSGIWVPLVTPFREGEVDFSALQHLARRIKSEGASGIVVCGSTGEAASLSVAEQFDVLDTVLDATAGCPIMMGLAGNNIADVRQRLEQMQRRHLAGILVPAPYYIRPSQAGLSDYFLTLAGQTDVPLVLYNIPYRTGVAMDFDTIAEIARHPRVSAIKDCGGDIGLSMRLIAETRLQVLAGEDHQLLSMLALGASGAIAASAHIRTDMFVRVVTLAGEGRIDEARTVFYRLLPLIRLLFQEPNPGPLKAALGMMGWMEDTLRFPLQKASPGLAEPLRQELMRLECLQPDRAVPGITLRTTS